MSRYLKGQMGTSLNGRVDIRKHKLNQKKIIFCNDCIYCEFTNYCSRKRKSIPDINKAKNCNLFKHKNILTKLKNKFDIDLLSLSYICKNLSCATCKYCTLNNKKFVCQHSEVRPICTITKLKNTRKKKPKWCPKK